MGTFGTWLCASLGRNVDIFGEEFHFDLTLDDEASTFLPDSNEITPVTDKPTQRLSAVHRQEEVVRQRSNPRSHLLLDGRKRLSRELEIQVGTRSPFIV